MSDFAPAVSIQDEVLDFLLTQPTPEQIIAFHASEAAQERMRYLLDANRAGSLTEAEAAELEEASQLNHLFTMLKAKAYGALQSE